ncbi:Glycoside hydrolase [Mycena indigotica]|uniref:non-reducing end alpha-L-arabinofuranosidase n=1 Tax=Mycena indigotica TaxID=2126181 RepID=A0A8H6SYJ4_9AGAR|nr:Glycoside hydrolase [Mycena indigotica]KAF7307530.1 Glycoside hydrolase [Mycena indigotica]
MLKLLLSLVLGFGAARGELLAPNALVLNITTTATHPIPSTLYGYMWEDINHRSYSGDGGLYAELLQNRAFQAVIPGTQNALTAWQPFNGARLSVTSRTPGVSQALPNSLQVQIPKVVSGPIGFENTGFWGIKVQSGWNYTGSFYAKSTSFTGSVTVSLKSTRGTTFASKTLSGVGREWKKFTFTFTPTSSASNDDNVLNFVVDGKESAGKTIFFGMFSLFPPTFRGRENGMRIDLAEALAGTGPAVWRFPGGNNLEGTSIATRWKWNETIGPLESRPGRLADWGYPNTDGLGLLEYLDWAEDLGAEPILGVWDGISTANYSELSTWSVVPEADLQPFIDDVLAELEFITGDAKSTKGGKLRASLGREEPYALKFIEIGNEDFFQADSYSSYRWNAFTTAIAAQYPGKFEFLATTLPSTALTPAYQKIDFHEYSSPSWFTNNSFMFDDYPRNGTQFFVGEYACTSTNDTNTLGDLPSGRLAYPTLEGSAAEAAFMTGMERNSDVVFASAYAPSFQHIRNFQWTPDIITYDASRLVKSTSYYVQQASQILFISRTHVLSTTPAPSPDTAPLFWVASYHNESDVVFLKVSNTGQTDLVANVFLSTPATSLFGSAVSLSSPALSQDPVSGQFNVSNTLDKPNQIIPVSSSFAFQFNDKFNYTFPATSITVLSFTVGESAVQMI